LHRKIQKSLRRKRRRRRRRRPDKRVRK